MQSHLLNLTPEELERHEFFEKAFIFCYDINEISGTDYTPCEALEGFAIRDLSTHETAVTGSADEVLNWLRNRYTVLKYN